MPETIADIPAGFGVWVLQRRRGLRVCVKFMKLSVEGALYVELAGAARHWETHLEGLLPKMRLPSPGRLRRDGGGSLI